MAAIERARCTSLKKMKLTDSTPQIAVSGEPRGGALQRLTFPSPSAPEAKHRCTGRLSTATPPPWSSSSPRAPPWMLQASKARGPRIRPVGTTGGGVEGWCDAEGVKAQLGEKLLDDFLKRLCTEL